MTTNRLLLRPVKLSDAEALLHVFSDPKVMEFGFGTQDFMWVKGRIRKWHEQIKLIGYGYWVITLKTTQEVIGYCSLTQQQELSPIEIELGYRLRHSMWGNGYATEAALVVRDYAFNILKIPRIIALIDPNNRASIRVAEKLGMQYERDIMLKGYSYPDHLYTINNQNPQNIP
jgi:[ribosomal protein S5]-alanine N-acetyltransferase